MWREETEIYVSVTSPIVRENQRGKKRRRRRRRKKKKSPTTAKEKPRLEGKQMLKHNRKWRSLRLRIKAYCNGDSMILRISRHQSVPWGQQPKKTSRLPISTASSCSYYGANTMAFSSQLRNVISPVCPGSNPGHSFQWDVPKTPHLGGILGRRTGEAWQLSEETNFHCLYPRSYSFSHYPRAVAKSEIGNADWRVHL